MLKLSLVHYIKWSILSFLMIFLNLVIYLRLETDTTGFFYFLSMFFVFVILFSEYLLQRKLSMRFDYFLLGILIVSSLQFTVIYLRDVNLAFIPSLILFSLLLIKFYVIRKSEYPYDLVTTKSYIIRLYFISYFLLALSLIIKSHYIYLLVGLIPLYLLSTYLMISNFKEFEKKQFLVYISIIFLILLYLSTTASNKDSIQYDIFFNLEYIIVSFIFLPHLFYIHKISKIELANMSKKKKMKHKKMNK